MAKKDVNPRIARWAFLFQNYDFTIEHRPDNKMKHAEALSPFTNVLLLYYNTFWVNQGGKANVEFRSMLGIEKGEDRNLVIVREESAINIEKTQEYNKKFFDFKHKKPTKYKKGDLVMIKNMDVSVGVNKKILSKFRGPYVIHYIFPNDRFIMRDVEGFQNVEISYEGVCSVGNMTHWLRNNK